jgi:spore coat polysaccharide biosynthesis predicted glycosyltransferase SpsG
MSQNNDIITVFRVDGNSKIGLGHIMRCIGLAQKFLDENVKSIFITKRDEKIEEKIRSFNFSVITLPNDIDLLTDAIKTKEITLEKNAKVIVTDIWHNETMLKPDDYLQFLSILKDEICVLATIDGPAAKFLDCDLLIVPYLGVEECNFQSNKLLIGSDYFIFRKEFISASKENKIINHEVKKILISIGGSDPDNLTIPALRAIIRYDNPTIDIITIIGSAYNYELVNEIESICEKSNKKIKIIKDSKDIAKLLLNSDILITSDGLTKYEASIIGTPTIVLSQMNKQHELKAGFYENESVLFVDINNEDLDKKLFEILKQMIENTSLRRYLSKKGKEFIDNKGIDRIYSEIEVVRNEKNC